MASTGMKKEKKKVKMVTEDQLASQKLQREVGVLIAVVSLDSLYRKTKMYKKNQLEDRLNDIFHGDGKNTVSFAQLFLKGSAPFQDAVCPLEQSQNTGTTTHYLKDSYTRNESKRYSLGTAFTLESVSRANKTSKGILTGRNIKDKAVLGIKNGKKALSFSKEYTTGAQAKRPSGDTNWDAHDLFVLNKMKNNLEGKKKVDVDLSQNTEAAVASIAVASVAVASIDSDNDDDDDDDDDDEIIDNDWFFPGWMAFKLLGPEAIANGTASQLLSEGEEWMNGKEKRSFGRNAARDEDAKEQNTERDFSAGQGASPFKRGIAMGAT
jgi:hypothetical protein